jgi:hypothetical protein
MTDQFRDADAAYVLGALSADARREFERHLTTCPACSAAVAELAGMPGILGKLSRDEAVALLDVPPAPARKADVVRGLAASVRKRRRRTRILAGVGALAVAGLLAATGFLAGSLGGAVSPASTAQPSAATIEMDQVTPGAMTATLSLTEKGWGTRFDWSCTYGADDWGPGETAATYALVVTDRSGVETTVATWAAAGDAAKGLVASSSVPTSAIQSVEIRLADTGTPLVRTDL